MAGMPVFCLISGVALIVFVLPILIFLFMFSSFIKIVPEGNVIIIENLGRFIKVGTHGVNLIIPIIQNVSKTIDMREQVREYPAQKVISRDEVTFKIYTILYYLVEDPLKFTYGIANPEMSLEKLCQATVSNIIREMKFDDTNKSVDTIKEKLLIVLDEATEDWGINVTRVELKI